MKLQEEEKGKEKAGKRRRRGFLFGIV